MKTNTRVMVAIVLAFLSVLTYAQAPVPFINLPLLPDATPPGGPQFTLTVNGTGFVPGSIVNWNGGALATQFVSASQLTAIVPATDIPTEGTASITVVNPAPGGGTSNVAFFSVTASTPSVAFVPAPTLVVGASPEAVAVGDFNGDGKLDLAVASLDSNAFVLLGDGTGNFTLASTPPAGSGPYSVAVGDFNGDGKLDLAVADYWANTVSVLLGDGTGNFTLASSPTVGSNPVSVAVGDFNRDGKLDLAVADYYGNEVSILLGDGTGNFTLASSPTVGTYPYSVAVGDFNGDGILDLAVANEFSVTVSILLGDGTGNFTLASSPGVASVPTSVAVGDFNGDGKLDLAVANGDGTVSILLGDGTGNFTPVAFPAVSGWLWAVAVGDFNGDGKLDLAVASAGTNTVSILLGDGTGNFTLAASPAVGNGPTSVALGDFSGDGRLSLAVANEANSNTVSILLGIPPGPYLTYSPTSLTFGTQLLGTSSNSQPVTLTNIGTAPLDITRAVASPNFSLTGNCPRNLAPGGQCTANVAFTPHNVNTITGTVSITDNAPKSPQTISLTGVGTAVTVVPSSLNFGNQPVGTTSQPQTVTFTNHASVALRIRGLGFTGSKASYAQTNSCGTSVPAGGSCTISVTFTPQGEGPRIATLEVNDNGGANPQTISLSGTGTEQKEAQAEANQNRAN